MRMRSSATLATCEAREVFRVKHLMTFLNFPPGGQNFPAISFLVLIRKISVVRAASVAVLMPQRILLFGSIARPASHKSDVSRGL